MGLAGGGRRSDQRLCSARQRQALLSMATIWTAGFGVPDLAAHSGLRTDGLGRLLTDETLTSVDDPRIVAAGDCRRAVGPAAADELPGRRAAGRAGRQHRAEPHRGHRACRDRPGLRGIVRQPGPARRHGPVGPQGRHRGELLHRRTARRLGEGGDLQGHAVGDPPRGPQARLDVLAQGRQASRAAGVAPQVVTES